MAIWLDTAFSAFDRAIFVAMNNLALNAGDFFTPLFKVITFLGGYGYFVCDFFDFFFFNRVGAGDGNQFKHVNNARGGVFHGFSEFGIFLPHGFSEFCHKKSKEGNTDKEH